MVIVFIWAYNFAYNVLIQFQDLQIHQCIFDDKFIDI